MHNVSKQHLPSSMEGETSGIVASVSMGLGGQLPPHFFEESTKSQTFLSVFTLELLRITQKSLADLVSAPSLFLENDAPYPSKNCYCHQQRS